MELPEQVRSLPERPGCYLMKDARGQIIYVGKARSLKNRVRTYFQSARNLTAKVLSMVSQVASLEYIVTDSEVEALILEANLIKKHRPKYNIDLKDDKSYPYLKVTLEEKWPRLMVTRRVKKDRARYFGPYTSAQTMWETLKLCRRIFPLHNCNRVEGHTRPCLNFHIGRCPGPCQEDFAGEEEYRRTVTELCAFLEGRRDEVIASLRKKMEEAADNLRFERAAEIRDQILVVEKALEPQKVVSSGFEDEDAVALAASGDEACAVVFFVRQGKLVGRETFFLNGAEGATGAEILGAFMKRFYSEAEFIPKRLLVPEDFEDRLPLAEMLSRRKGSKVILSVARRGEKRKLLEMAAENARLSLEERRAARRREAEATAGAGESLRDGLGLERAPRRIECFDISNLMGQQAVGSMVVFIDGRPARDQYRRFRIRSVQGPDDFASMAEVIRRRFASAAAGDGGRDGFAQRPDLVIVDGGKGQLSAARREMKRLGHENVPTFGLAKENEWLFADGRTDPIILPRDSAALYLLQRIRDEAHRFAISYHRKLRGGNVRRSLLDEIPGIGPARKKTLIRQFGSVSGIRRASVEELMAVKGISQALAEKIKETLEVRR